jgi:ribonuclease P protein component
VLAKSNRVVRAADFRATMRTGKRFNAPHMVVYLRDREEGEPSRFGFVISKAVGGSVVRNRLRRRMRAISYDLVKGGSTGKDIVVRALPGSASLDWSALRSEIVANIARSSRA